MSIYPQRHWSLKSELGTVLGIKLLLRVYTLLGWRAFDWLLRPVILYYYAFARTARHASGDYLRRLSAYAEKNNVTLHGNLTSYRHFLSFGRTMLNNLAAWRGDMNPDDITRHGFEHYNDILQRERGVVILGSHLGSLEVCRAMGRMSRRRTVNALVFTKHAARFNSVMKAVNPDSNVNLIHVDVIGPDTAILLKQKLDAGEWVVLVGDRTSASREGRVVWADFLGEPAPFPQGPFILASILREPVYLVFGLRDENSRSPHYHVYFEPFRDDLVLPRDRREAVLKEVVTQYARRLECHVLKAPLQWFNFFPFWQLSKPHHD